MCKIKVNYDLIKKINESKKGIKLHKIFKTRAFTDNSASFVLDFLLLDLFLYEETTLELLKDAKVIQTNYKFNFEDGNLKQTKYIKVPLIDGYTTLLQEHNIGSKEYEISVNEPVKKMDYKLAKTTI